jgi:FtsZ-binding cell division protein ZapB
VALKEKNEDLKQANEALRARNKKLEERNKALHQDISSLKRVVELEAAECKELRARLDQLEQTSASHPRSASESPKKREIKPSAGWQEKIDGYKRRFQELVAENSRLLHQTSEQENLIRAQTTSFARELEATRGAGFVKMQRISDTEIQSKWKALCFAVRQFVTTHLPEALDLKTVQVLLQQQEFKWLPEAAKTLQSPVFCSIILESWVWHFLCFRIFDCCSSFWAGELGKELCALNERVGGERHLFFSN